MYTSTKRSNYVSQTIALVNIAVFFGRARMYTSTKISSYISQKTDLVSIAVFLGVHECTLVPRDQVTSVKQLIFLA